jgi:hypothetical protein
MAYAVPRSVTDAVERAAREGRIIQGEWRRAGAGGKTLVNALAAFGPDIHDPSDIPPSYMPRWLAELIPALGDGISSGRLPEFSLALAAQARQWHALGDAAWARIRSHFLCGCVRQALDAAASVQPAPRPAYWDRVREVCDAVLAALERSGDLVSAREAVLPWALPEGVLSTQPAPADAT